MPDPKYLNPAPSPPGGAPAQPTGKAPEKDSSGRVVHDARGNAVWDWVKQTSRIAIESTSALLKKLEAPELKMEDTHDKELRIVPDGKSCAGGGYDPYSNTAPPPRKPGKVGHK